MFFFAKQWMFLHKIQKIVWATKVSDDCEHLTRAPSGCLTHCLQLFQPKYRNHENVIEYLREYESFNKAGLACLSKAKGRLTLINATCGP